MVGRVWLRRGHRGRPLNSAVRSHTGTCVRTQGFDPIADSAARVLILGTLPSQVSLQKGQYYAQPRNVFWKIMSELFSFDRLASYSARTDRLISEGVALWDVCHSADRPGSLD